MKRTVSVMLALLLIAVATAVFFACGDEKVTEAATEQTTEQATVATEKATENVTEDATEPATDAATDATTEPATGAVTEAETEETTEAVTDATTEPATEEATEAETEAATEPATEPESESESESESETEAATEKETTDGEEYAAIPEEFDYPIDAYTAILGADMISKCDNSGAWDLTEKDEWMTENVVISPNWANLVSLASQRTFELRMQTIHIPEDAEFDTGTFISINWILNGAYQSFTSQRLDLGTGLISNCGRYFPNVDVQEAVECKGFIQFIDTLHTEGNGVWVISTYANGKLVFRAKTNPGTAISTGGWNYPAMNNNTTAHNAPADACMYDDVRTLNLYVWDNYDTEALQGKTEASEELIRKLYTIFATYHHVGEYAD